MSRAGGADLDGAGLLRVLADLTSSASATTNPLVIPTEWFQWLPVADALRLTNEVDPTLEVEFPTRVAISTVDRRFGDGLAAIEQVRGQRSTIRLGWLFVAGSFPAANGGQRRVFHPLVTVDVEVSRPPFASRATLLRTDDAQLTELIEDPVIRHGLMAHIAVGGGGLHGDAGPDDVAVAAAVLGDVDRGRAASVLRLLEDCGPGPIRQTSPDQPPG